MAVEDAYSLMDAVESVGLNGKAFELYEKQRREKVDWTVSTSWNIGRMCHWKNPVLRRLRNAAPAAQDAACAVAQRKRSGNCIR